MDALCVGMSRGSSRKGGAEGSWFPTIRNGALRSHQALALMQWTQHWCNHILTQSAVILPQVLENIFLRNLKNEMRPHYGRASAASLHMSLFSPHVSCQLLQGFHSSALFILYSSDRDWLLPPVHDKEAKQSVRAVVVCRSSYRLSVRTWHCSSHRHCRLPHFPSLLLLLLLPFLVMEKLSGCSRCGQAASLLPQLLYITAE